ncbi:hypothetical protein CUJ84_Chr004734 [Rhizobium leguminosarum]|uniref:Uncharacterized protein n=1 Tax=Rhizobium leguminosarum TaxID=384 RepID=A0A2K9Z9U9_RHILE|nr:hypothetical protein CUJ84_Chr004734 [Rhizobium leguminosarum]
MTMTAPAAFSDMISKIRMMTAFDDLFDVTLSTILHASVEMFAGTKNRKTGLSLSFDDESGKSLTISHFQCQKSAKTILRTALLEIFSRNLLLACEKSDIEGGDPWLPETIRNGKSRSKARARSPRRRVRRISIRKFSSAGQAMTISNSTRRKCWHSPPCIRQRNSPPGTARCLVSASTPLPM